MAVEQSSIHSFEGMTNLSKATRALLEEHFIIKTIAAHDQQQRSTDGTIKNAVQLFDGRIVESVLIPVKDRTTACVSSQVGCSLDCPLCYCCLPGCATSIQTRFSIKSWPSISKAKPISIALFSNIVFMGMGETLDELQQYPGSY